MYLRSGRPFGRAAALEQLRHLLETRVPGKLALLEREDRSEQPGHGSGDPFKVSGGGRRLGIGGEVQRIVAEAWEEVGLPSTTATHEEDYSMKLVTFEEIDRSIVTLNAELDEVEQLLCLFCL